jgi:pimeloyl-ACP methyl ester carboxylesterase
MRRKMKMMSGMLRLVGLLLVLAGFGFWVRPVSYLNGYSYLCFWMAGAESRSVTVAGHHIHYDVAGPKGGPVVVLVHGLSGRAENWQSLAPYLVKAGYRVYMLDLLGFGRSEKPEDFSYSMEDQAAIVDGALDALGLKRVDLGGWSMGGWIVQRVAIEHPERIRRLVLFDSAGLNELPAWNTQLFTPASIAELQQFEALLMPHPPSLPDFISRDLLRNSEQNAWVVQRALGTMLAGQYTMDSLLPGLKMPVLIIWGTDDRIFPLRHGEVMHRLIANSQLETFPGCGHLAPIQCASRIGPRVVEFLKQ